MKRTLCASLLALAISAARLFGAAPVYTNNFAAVTLDGVRLGADLDPSGLSQFPSVVYDPTTGVFHMWVIAGATQSVEDIKHATSPDGVHFTSTGFLSFAGGSPFPVNGAPVEPPFVFPRAAKVGTDWKLLLWTHNDPSGATGDYNYNESLNDIGADPATLAVAHQGPFLPTNGAGTYGQTTGPFGMIGSNLYVADDRPGGISKWNFNDTTPPSVDVPADEYQDLITGTGYVFFLTHPGDPLGVYVHNVGRVLDQGDGTLGVYYSLRFPDGSRVNKQIYYAQSGDNGQSWSAPVGIFANGNAVRVDNAPNTFEFSHPESTLAGSRRILYFSTKAADGQSVVATSAAQAALPGSWSGIFGSGSPGDGESGRAVVRTSAGGYAVAANSSGLTANPVGFWLLRLDGNGQLESQRIYTEPTAGPRTLTSLAQAADGGLVLGGSSGNGATGIVIIKIDTLGGVAWSNSLTTTDASIGGSADELDALIRTSDGGFAFAGRVASYFGLGKIDANGVLQWIRSYPAGAAPGDDTRASALVETPEGGLAAVGTWTGPSVRVLKTDATGNIQWEKTYSAGTPSGIANRAGDGFIVNTLDKVLALDSTGGLVWQKTYTGFGAAGAIIPSTAGYGVPGVYGDAVLLEIDANGNPLWARQFAAQQSSASIFHAAVAMFDGGILAVGDDKVGSDSRLLAVKVDAGGQFIGCLDVEISLDVTGAATSATPSPLPDTAVDELANTTVAAFPVTGADTDAPERLTCSATLPQTLEPASLAVDPSGNGVADPGEQFLTEPAWTNYGLLATFLSGHSSPDADTNGLDAGAPNPNADYGTVPALATADCASASGECYEFGFKPVPRPSQHWDTYFDETLRTSDPHHQFARRWTIHAGLSFSDVSPSSGFYPFIEDIFHNGITVGCGATNYCPGSSTTRAQMAAFLLKSKFGSDHVPPPATGTVFNDVPADAPFAAWIEELASLGITGGCGGGNYCPNDPVTRQQMSAFLLKSLNGSGYVPPPAAGIFGDVPQSDLFAPWIEDLYNRQITAGCSASPLLYCPADPNTRAQMAVFLTKTFSLVLYGP
jgi:S-layer homology domain